MYEFQQTMKGERHKGIDEEAALRYFKIVCYFEFHRLKYKGFSSVQINLGFYHLRRKGYAHLFYSVFKIFIKD